MPEYVVSRVAEAHLDESAARCSGSVELLVRPLAGEYDRHCGELQEYRAHACSAELAVKGLT